MGVTTMGIICGGERISVTCRSIYLTTDVRWISTKQTRHCQTLSADVTDNQDVICPLVDVSTCRQHLLQRVGSVNQFKDRNFDRLRKV